MINNIKPFKAVEKDKRSLKADLQNMIKRIENGEIEDNSGFILITKAENKVPQMFVYHLHPDTAITLLEASKMGLVDDVCNAWAEGSDIL